MNPDGPRFNSSAGGAEGMSMGDDGSGMNSACFTDSTPGDVHLLVIVFLPPSRLILPTRLLATLLVLPCAAPTVFSECGQANVSISTVSDISLLGRLAKE